MNYAPVALLALGGILVGGVWSLWKQEAPKFAVAVVAVLALLAVGGGVLWLVPK